MSNSAVYFSRHMGTNAQTVVLHKFKKHLNLLQNVSVCGAKIAAPPQFCFMLYVGQSSGKRQRRYFHIKFARLSAPPVSAVRGTPQNKKRLITHAARVYKAALPPLPRVLLQAHQLAEPLRQNCGFALFLFRLPPPLFVMFYRIIYCPRLSPTWGQLTAKI